MRRRQRHPSAHQRRCPYRPLMAAYRDGIVPAPASRPQCAPRNHGV